VAYDNGTARHSTIALDETLAEKGKEIKIQRAKDAKGSGNTHNQVTKKEKGETLLEKEKISYASLKRGNTRQELEGGGVPVSVVDTGPFSKTT